MSNETKTEEQVLETLDLGNGAAAHLPIDGPPAEEQTAAAAEPEEERPHRSRYLPCPLTQDELIELGDKIDALISEIEDLEAAKKSSASAYKAQIDSKTEDLQKLSKQRRGRVIDREVEIEIEQDLARGDETVRRLDTGEVVTKRTLSRREVEELRQTKVPGTEIAAEPKAEEDPWAKLPDELGALLKTIDDGNISAVKTDHLRALVTYAKERQIPPDDQRVVRITRALAARRKPEADEARAALKKGEHGKCKKGNAAPAPEVSE